MIPAAAINDDDCFHIATLTATDTAETIEKRGGVTSRFVCVRVRVKE